MTIDNESVLKDEIWKVIHSTPVLDMHTHLYDARFDKLLLWGADELLTYHYLIAEVFRLDPRQPDVIHESISPEEFLDLPKRIQADIIWHRCFLAHSPLSEATRGVLTALGLLGINPAVRNLNDFRRHFEEKTLETHIDDVFRIANLESVVMTNDPFDEVEREVWENDGTRDPRFKAALRLDAMLNNWGESYHQLKAWGYAVKKRLDKNVYPEVQRFLADWCEQINPVYLAVTLPPHFDMHDKSDCSKLIHKVILPFCRENQLPLALMIGVKRMANPALQLAGDSVGKADIGVLEELCRENPEVKFLVTMLSRENQHELAVTARKFGNLMPFGCWWYLNDPCTIDEITRMRLELLGLSFIPQHSDARVLEQVLYKWAHSRWQIGHILQKKYVDLYRTGWRVTSGELQRDIYNLLNGNFKKFVGIDAM